MASANMGLTSAMLTALREYVRDKISYAQYKVGSTWYRAELNEKAVLNDGRVSISFEIDHTIAGNITVTGIRLLNYSGVVWAEKTVSITRADAVEGILYRCRFSVIEDSD